MAGSSYCGFAGTWRSFGYIRIIGKKRFEADSIPKATWISFENAFKVEYTNHSTAIEGNTPALEENVVKDIYAPLMNYQLMTKGFLFAYITKEGQAGVL